MGLLDYACLGLMVLHVAICPFTKVEESFNLQAMHDILYHGSDLQQYDHLDFPGVVPRSFLGPLFISVISAPAVKVTQWLGHSKFISQCIVRLMLGLCVFYSFEQFRRAICARLGPSVGRWLIVITATQFHLMFYMSRPLPNIFALALVMQAYFYWLRHKPDKFIWTSALAIIVFRGELALLLGLIVVVELLTRRLSLLELFKYGAPAGIVWLGLTVGVDSIFWGRWLWPEGEVFWYNTILNKSSNWGTLPFLWYFYSAIPRSLGISLFLVPIGAYLDRRTLALLLPALGFVLLFSVLPHKELRFIIYVFPILNAVAATACARMWEKGGRSKFGSLLALVTVGQLMVNVATTCGFLYVSLHNYPGGEAIMKLQEMEQHYIGARVHIDVATAQTGVSRFTQLYDSWKYSKTENLEPGGAEMMSYSHLLIGVTDNDLSEIQPYNSTHKLLHTVYAFSGVRLNSKGYPPVALTMSPRICVLRNNAMPRWPPKSGT